MYDLYLLQLQKWELDYELHSKDKLVDLVLAANFLCIDCLVTWTCRMIAGIINENPSASLTGLPDETQLVVAEYLEPYVLQQAIKAGVVPIPTSGELLECARHAYTWSTVLDKDEFSYLVNFFSYHGNAILFGQDLKRIYNGFPQKATQKRQAHLLLTWHGTKFIKDNLNWDRIINRATDVCKKGKIYKTIHFRNPDIVLTIREPITDTRFGFDIELEDIEPFVNTSSLEATILNVTCDCSLQVVDMKMEDSSGSEAKAKYCLALGNDRLLFRTSMHLTVPR